MLQPWTRLKNSRLEHPARSPNYRQPTLLPPVTLSLQAVYKTDVWVSKKGWQDYQDQRPWRAASSTASTAFVVAVATPRAVDRNCAGVNVLDPLLELVLVDVPDLGHIGVGRVDQLALQASACGLRYSAVERAPCSSPTSVKRTTTRSGHRICTSSR
jgi:hypothetical protein